MENQQNIQALFTKYLSGKYNRQELQQLLDYFQLDEEKDNLLILINAEMIKNQDLPADEYVVAQIANNLDGKIFRLTKPATRVKKLLPWISVAAVLALVSFLTFYFYSQHTESKNQIAFQSIEIAPGTQNAVLTLSNGEKIVLKNSIAGQIANQPGTTVSKSADGQLIYSAVNNSNPSNSAYNTIETPRGGEYQVVLPDGTKVWLNAASSLKYPTSFGALKERKVELSGEAYFEVTHDKSKPFRVKTNKQVVEVLGTHFNINSYADEAKIVTTLQEGRVKVSSGNSNLTINPGQRTVLSSVGNMMVQQADLESALAWKNGKIYFKKADLKSIMREVARWYNIEIEYEGNFKNRLFTGGVSRSSNLSALLKILELNDIHFRMGEKSGQKQLIITP